MGWWILLGILALILLLPFGASIFFDSEGLRVRVIAGPVRFTVFPTKKKEKKATEKTKTKEKSESEPKRTQPAPTESKADEPEKMPLPEAPKPPKEEEPKGGSITDFLPLVELALKFVGEFFHKTLHIDVLYLKLTMAGDDPADLAIGYGRAWAALGNLWPYIDRMFTIKKRDVKIQCDFEGDQPLVNARVDIILNLARLLGLVFSYGFRILIKFLKIQNDRKIAAGSAVKKSKKTQTNEGGAI